MWQNNALHLLLVLALSGCSSDPEFVYVPASEQKVELELHLDDAAVINQPMVLSASRRNIGDWQLVEHKSLSAEDCRMANPPEPIESEVADNVHWLISNSSGTPAPVTLNLDLREDHTRTAIFTQTGRYQLVAKSHIWCGDQYVSEPVWVTVN